MLGGLFRNYFKEELRRVWSCRLEKPRNAECKTAFIGLFILLEGWKLRMAREISDNGDPAYETLE